MNMTFADKLNKIFDILGCNSSEFEHETGYNRSSVSRFRNGSRVPNADSKSLYKLVEQIFIYADSKNMLKEVRILCSCTDIKGKGKCISAISIWLCEGSEKSVIPKKSVTVNEKKPSCRFFGEKLNAIMNMLGMSNVRLGRLISIDPSYISRFRIGIRTPKQDTELTKSLCRCLAVRICETEKQSEFAALMHKPRELLSDDAEEILLLLSDWLFDIGNDRNSIAVDSFLSHINEFITGNSIEIIPFNMINADCSENEYYGIDGLRNAVVRFLLSTAQNENEQLLLYSDRAIDWLIGDREFYEKWRALMVHNLRHGTKICIIHNIDRGLEEMLAAIKSWIPLYMSGLIEAYICKKPLHSRFAHTLFISTGSSVISYNVRGAENNALCSFSENANDVSRSTDEFRILLGSCERLIQVYTQREYSNLMLRIVGLQSREGTLMFMPHTLSIATMTEELLLKILERNAVESEEKECLLRFHRITRDLLFATLKSNDVYEYVPFADDEELFDGKVRLNFDSAMTMREIIYTDEEFREHILCMRELLDIYTNYHVYALPVNPFENVEILIKGKTVVVMKTNSPSFAMIFEQSLMQNAFEEYFNSIAERCVKERSEVREAMERYI